MARRNIFHAPQFSEVYPIHSSYHSNTNPPRPCENTILGSNAPVQINLSMEFPSHSAANCGPDHHQYEHPVSTGSSFHNWTYQTQNAPYHYIQHANQSVPSMTHPPAVHGGTLKRKSPYVDNNFGYQFAESSSNSFAHPNHIQPNRPLHPSGIVSHYQCGNLSFPGQRYQRNVRSRLNLGWPSSSSRPYQFQPSANISGQTVMAQWRHSSPSGISAQAVDAGCSNYSLNQSIMNSASGGSATENYCAYNIDRSSNPCTMLPAFHVSANRGIGSIPSSYNQRQYYNRIPSNYTNPGIADAAVSSFEDTEISGSGSVALSRNPWPPALHNSFRNGVPRNSNQVQPFLNVGSAHRRWTSQGPSLMDVPPYTDPLELFDEHRDLRLDIENMSYEELLALEERIGNVNTGLSEDHLTKCLTDRIYSLSASADDEDDEHGCAICLELYNDGDNLGMLKCNHVYHVACIIKWLELKNACPICKTAAMDDTAQQKEKDS
ncbi:E3 ubiquitin ligase BIG BROTHER [Apostasia shenzhenica]|uniref:RING-type E3 ubiquitin transferase n=1 Tax=Apostasia shenzhenica TaxID=1088818 RepID=A0A2I0AKW0_9ASPA|nr:E3 ubiquitin ligase BIG BROTHER [Apostasia shenzhenica]